MRILIYGINYSPEITGIGKYSGEMAEWLAQSHEVRVICAPPYYPAWKVSDGFSAYCYSAEMEGEVRTYRCPLYVPQQATGLKRLIHLATFALSSFPVALWQAASWRPDVILCVAPALFCAPGGWLASRIAGARAWLHLQDFEVDAAFQLGLLKWAPARSAALCFESWLLRRFDCVSTLSARMLSGLERKGCVRSRLSHFPNWVDSHVIHPLAGRNPLRAELAIPQSRRIVLYSGSMGEKQGLEIVIEAARMLGSHSEVEFILCGNGAARARLEQMANGQKNVRFLPLQPMEKLNELLNMADIHVLPQRADAADLVMPSKLTNILACGGAVIATAQPQTELGQVVLAAGGRICAPGNAQELKREIEALANMPESLSEMRKKSREYALRHWSKEAVLKTVEAELLALISRKLGDDNAMANHMSTPGCETAS